MEPGPTGEIHVWNISLAVSNEKLRRYRTLLSEEERQQADRFVTYDLGRRYAVAHAALRLILQDYAKRNEIEFTKNEQGKPSIPDFSFNLTHSNEMALLALTREGDIGIDIEFAKDTRDRDSIVEKTFADAEWEEYSKLPEAQRLESFYRGWTRKEAFIKAIGKGLSCDLKSFAVSMTPGSPARLRFLEEETRHGKDWSICDLPAPVGYYAALVAEGTIKAIKFLNFPEDLNAAK